MNFNVYLDDQTGQRLNRAAEASGESRNALVRQAVSEWLARHGQAGWPALVLEFQGLPEARPFEADRGQLEPPRADPLE